MFVDNSCDVSGSEAPHRIATLWELAWNDERLACVVCRAADGLRIRIESPTKVIMSEHFTFQPRTVARMRALRDSLERRGWASPLAGASGSSTAPAEDPGSR